MENGIFSGTKTGRRVLVVDDESGFRDMLTWSLGRQGIPVDIARDGDEAVAMAKATQYALVITDLTMPKLDGMSLLDELKKKSPQAEVMIMTGFGTVEMAVNAIRKGAFDFILKPFDIDHLTLRVKQALEKHP